MEYMAFVKHDSEDKYVENQENVLDSQAVRGLLFVDELSQPTAAESAIDIVQYPGEIGQVMD